MSHTAYRSRPSGATLARLAGLLLASAVPAVWGVSPAMAQDGDTVLLDRITLEGASYETDDSDSYTSGLVSVGEKDVLSVREIPQSTSVLTRERIEDGGYTSLDTALRDTPGIVVLNNDNGRSSLFSRGFEFDSLYFNGLSAPLSSVYGTQPDLAIVDHIEILRGPSGLFGGNGEPAGAINMRLKQAKRDFEARFEGAFGSWAHKRGEVDITGPLNESGSVRGRFVGVLQDEDGFVDETKNGVGVAYGTIQADIGTNTTATLSINHQARDINPFNGLPTLQDGTLLDLPRSTFTGQDWNDFNNSVTDYIAELEHKFEDGGHAKLSARYQHTDVDFLYAWANGYAAPNGDIISGGGDTDDTRWLARDYSYDSVAVDAHVSKPFELFGQEHNVIVGADYQSFDSTLRQGAGTITGDQNIYNWNSGLARPVVNYTTQTGIKTDKFGLYGQLRVKPFERLTLIGGGRLSWYDATTTNLLSGAVTNRQTINAKVTPYAGAVFDLTEWLSAYSSYTEIFQPQTETDISGTVLDPREGRQVEAGLKAEFFDGNVNASMAYFNLRDVNRAVADPGNPGVSIAQGEVEVQGFEIEASGTVLPGWEISGGYTFTDSQYLNGGSAGQVFSTYTPKHMLQLWTKYTFDERFDRLNGLFVGGGLTAFSSFSSVSRGITIEAPGYITADLMAGYKLNDNLTATLNINNVFDKKYYSRVGGNSVFNFYGEPRSAQFRLSAKF
ncbi:MAG: TonB-dependent siderophore receptor [Stappia sp.]|uniref:TonB-dependent siderophore receptor n=1 Tax=Stappia sp. TaxID=1870903 RepID=UPI000C4BB50F|nr:TonB-dependent siderophore receptor [Stappia sp.]MAA97240.1 TonB-dependent siderophore receptor [Stappia sp.]MBM19076.1 TonB-dependent siderophore receptor [Stappia sp.]